MTKVCFNLPAQTEGQENVQFSMGTGHLKHNLGCNVKAPDARIERLTQEAGLVLPRAAATEWSANPKVAHDVYQQRERQYTNLTQDIQKWEDNPTACKVKRGLLITAYITGIVAISALTIGMMLVSLGIFGAVGALTSFMLAVGAGCSLIALKEYLGRIGPKLPPSLSDLQKASNVAKVVRDESLEQAKETVAKFKAAVAQIEAQSARSEKDERYLENLQRVVAWADDVEVLKEAV